MLAPNLQTADFVAAMQNLLPRGAAWPRDPSAVMTAVITGLCGVYAQSTTDANDLLAQAFPATAVEMLPEWQETLGLSNPGGTLTLTQEQGAVVAALIDSGGQSIAYYTSLAAALGIAITVTEFSQFSVDRSVIAPLTDAQWPHVWQVNAPAAAAISYTVTADVVPTTPGLGNPLLDALLGRTKPAHTVCLTSYT